MGVTIKDVAKAAGTSVSTVSKVINGHYSISEETARRVREVMQELNYYPSASAQSFARGITKEVAVLADLSPNRAFRNPHLFEIISGLEETLRAKGYQLTLRGVDAANVCANNSIAMGCVASIQERGLDIPGDMGVMAFDDYPLSQFIEPPLTVVDINVRDMGNQAGRFLLDMIRHPNRQVQTYVTTSNILARQSTRRPKQR